MSSKSSKKAKPLSVPRSMPEIQTAYQQLCANAGQVQYQLSIYTKELARLNQQIEAVNHEGTARMQLDKEGAKTEEAPAQTEAAQA